MTMPFAARALSAWISNMPLAPTVYGAGALPACGPEVMAAKNRTDAMPPEPRASTASIQMESPVITVGQHVEGPRSAPAEKAQEPKRLLLSGEKCSPGRMPFCTVGKA